MPSPAAKAFSSVLRRVPNAARTTRNSAASSGARTAGRKVAGVERYPYHTPRFSQLLAESYEGGDAGDPRAFYTWMETTYQASAARYPGKEALGLDALLQERRQALASIADPVQKAQLQRELAAWAHRLVTTLFPHMSLDRGFEFFNAARDGERHPFLQSVLIAALLQQAGVDAGVAMVYRNPRGEETNNGHTVALVKLAGGRDLVVDASAGEPFVRPQGLLLRAPQYRYLQPVYDQTAGEILYYLSADGRASVPTVGTRDLDYNFLRSQFWYYRGERSPGGLLAKTPTEEGIKRSERALRTSTRLCRKNALALYTLGRVSLALGKTAEGRRFFQEAYKLYAEAGWIPDEPRQALAGVDFTVDPRTLVSVIGPNGAGKTTLFNCIGGLYRPDSGTIRFQGRSLIGLKPDAIARLGIARTFQNIELFRSSTVLDNVLLGRHLHFRAGFVAAALGTPPWRREEVRHRRRAEEILDFLDLQSARGRRVGDLPIG
ncbi:MAG: ATP-binding cassette domain-containing protein, partial [Alicyclobacillus mali]|uniref:ATP-binding cassette domain-containing protein n=1 Tax=Alicyclobacillus mali (ex Roth et al. 2021) TaxID=1123961 RepID=UPI0023F52860